MPKRSNKYDMLEQHYDAKSNSFESETFRLTHQLRLDSIERNKKEFDNHKSKIELWLQIIQLIIVKCNFYNRNYLFHSIC